jgi:hypothetical protein
LIAPHVVADTTSAQRSQATAAVDRAIGERLRLVLHAPAFQALEAPWRGVRWLLDNLDLDDDLEVHLLDITRAELLADALRCTPIPRRRRYGDGWPTAPLLSRRAALVRVRGAFFDVGASDDDLTWLSALGAIPRRPGRRAGHRQAVARERPNRAPARSPRLRLVHRRPPHWHALRHSELAPWIGLAAPRLLMRQPYGATTDPIEDIPFEEFSGPPEHAHLLWAPADWGVRCSSAARSARTDGRCSRATCCRSPTSRPASWSGTASVNCSRAPKW